MTNDTVEIVITGGAGAIAVTAADHIALVLMGAGATVGFPGRQNQTVRPGQTLRGVHAVVQMAEGASVEAGRIEIRVFL